MRRFAILLLRWAVLLAIIGFVIYWMVFVDGPPTCAEWGCGDDIY